MTFLDQHWDAAGVALILIVVIALIDRGYTRAATRMRGRHSARLDRANDAYWRLHRKYRALCTAGFTVEQAAAEVEAEELARHVDEPIPYGLPGVPNPYAPAWTSGALLDDGAHVHTEFGQAVRTRFGRETG